MKDTKRALITLKKPKRRKIQPGEVAAPTEKVSQVKKAITKPGAEESSEPPEKKVKEYKTDTNPNAGQSNNNRDADVKRLNDHLWTRPVWREFKPLAIGILHDVFKQADKVGASRKAARVLMRQHTVNDKYIANLADNTESISRYDLNGKPVGFVMPEARYSALAIIERRTKAKSRDKELKRKRDKLKPEPEPPQMSLDL